MSSSGYLSGVPSTNVPQPTFSALGFQIPTDNQILAGVLADLNGAFGGNLNIVNLATPQGQLASSMSAIIADADQTFLFYTTQVDPAFAEGRMQDAIGRIYFITRLPASQTVVSCVCTGAGVTIQTGALAQDSSGNTYLCLSGGTIPIGGGSITLQFANQIVGPIPCPQGTLTTIYKAVPGWDSITNPSEGVLGANVESRAAFETRRQASVAQNSMGSLPSIIGEVLNVPGVLDAYATENPTASPVTILGQTLPANSLYVAAVGGDSQAVAQAIWSRKAPGCAYVGNTSETVYDTSNGYNPPYPSYAVTYEIPPGLPIYFSVTLVQNAALPANATALIQNAIVNAFAGGDGGPRARIGNNILASRYYSPVASLGPWALIQSLYIGSANVSDWVGTGTISGSTFTEDSTISGALQIGDMLQDADGRIAAGTQVLSGSNPTWVLSNTQTVAGASFTGNGSGTNLTTSAVTGTIGIGDLVAGTGVPSATYIVSQTSGVAGGAGVYVTSNATTSSGASLTTTPVITAVDVDVLNVQVNINQVPTIAAANILVGTSSV
jgi:hypothetical protein